ncbi:ABC transporter ATP-binding protein [Nocardioides daejeonensis]|uniref:ABC transporter ATP-binding protein n=1 Tax=Nocardioides daejeonensis TaxID=1046556 RepID=UPI0013A559B3|nr:ATP-binding cassette domain-containing protein [Nocardioides daejeonensis]
MTDYILEACNVVKTYEARGAAAVHALKDVSLGVAQGETVGLVGESGSGKTTLMRMLLAIEEPTTGVVRFRGTPRNEMGKAEMKEYFNNVSAVFQNPFSSLNPRRRLWDVMTERRAIERRAKKSERRERAAELTAMVGLPEDYIDRYPHQLSGGQRQRIAIARALAEDPSVIVLDEPMSALDVSVSAQIANLLLELQENFGVGFLLIGHDMDMIRHLCHRVAVLYKGDIVEQGPVDAVMRAPEHDYTKRLLAASELTSLEIDDLEPVESADAPFLISQPVPTH